MKDSVLILSGGVDSTTLLYDEQERIALAISFDYGSKHNAREIPFARMLYDEIFRQFVAGGWGGDSRGALCRREHEVDGGAFP